MYMYVQIHYHPQCLQFMFVHTCQYVLAVRFNQILASRSYSHLAVVFKEYSKVRIYVVAYTCTVCVYCGVLHVVFVYVRTYRKCMGTYVTCVLSIDCMFSMYFVYCCIYCVLYVLLNMYVRMLYICVCCVFCSVCVVRIVPVYGH